MAHPDLMRLVAWSTLEPSVSVADGRAASHDAKIDALARRPPDGGREREFSPAFLVTTVMAVATAWSPSLPFGVAMHPDRPLPLAELRDQVVRATRRLAGSD